MDAVTSPYHPLHDDESTCHGERDLSIDAVAGLLADSLPRVDDLGINGEQILRFYRDCFAELPWDWYDVKRKQWEMLPPKITQRSGAAAVFKEYYVHRDATLDQFCDTLDLDESWNARLSILKPWRRRSVCCFAVSFENGIAIERVAPDAFKQQVVDTDLRALPRVFQQTKSRLVENDLFHQLLRGIAKHIQRVTPHVAIERLNVSAHFMRVLASAGTSGSNAPEGPHEDGADFIVSALVIQRENISGGSSQIFEKMRDGRMVKIFERELQPGEFLFQADTGEEKHYGNDLWHYVTPVVVLDPQKQGLRDIIGFDVSIARGRATNRDD